MVCLLETFLEGKRAADFSFFSHDPMDFQSSSSECVALRSRYE